MKRFGPWVALAAGVVGIASASLAYYLFWHQGVPTLKASLQTVGHPTVPDEQVHWLTAFITKHQGEVVRLTIDFRGSPDEAGPGEVEWVKSPPDGLQFIVRDPPCSPEDGLSCPGLQYVIRSRTGTPPELTPYDHDCCQRLDGYFEVSQIAIPGGNRPQPYVTLTQVPPESVSKR